MVLQEAAAAAASKLQQAASPVDDAAGLQPATTSVQVSTPPFCFPSCSPPPASTQCTNLARTMHHHRTRLLLPLPAVFPPSRERDLKLSEPHSNRFEIMYCKPQQEAAARKAAQERLQQEAVARQQAAEDFKRKQEAERKEREAPMLKELAELAQRKRVEELHVLRNALNAVLRALDAAAGEASLEDLDTARWVLSHLRAMREQVDYARQGDTSAYPGVSGDGRGLEAEVRAWDEEWRREGERLKEAEGRVVLESRAVYREREREEQLQRERELKRQQELCVTAGGAGGEGARSAGPVMVLAH
jgi:hypothetical protein